MWPGTTWRPQHTCRLQERPLSGLWSPTISPSCCWSWSCCILLDEQRAVWSQSIRYALRSKHRLCVLRSVGTKKMFRGGCRTGRGAGQRFLRYSSFSRVSSPPENTTKYSSTFFRGVLRVLPSSQFWKFRRNFSKSEEWESTGTTTSTTTGVVLVPLSSPQTGKIQDVLLNPSSFST